MQKNLEMRLTMLSGLASQARLESPILCDTNKAKNRCNDDNLESNGLF